MSGRVVFSLTAHQARLLVTVLERNTELDGTSSPRELKVLAGLARRSLVTRAGAGWLLTPQGVAAAALALRLAIDSGRGGRS